MVELQVQAAGLKSRLERLTIEHEVSEIRMRERDEVRLHTPLHTHTRTYTHIDRHVWGKENAYANTSIHGNFFPFSSSTDLLSIFKK